MIDKSESALIDIIISARLLAHLVMKEHADGVCLTEVRAYKTAEFCGVEA